MKNLQLVLFAGMLIFCLNAGTAVSQSLTNYPPQYGKPFNGVPDRRDVAMYQINTRSFSRNGDLKGVTARLDSIKSLKINVVYLMPIYPVGVLKGSNSPYATKDYDQVGSEFGTLDDLRALVAGAHDRRISVMLDFVANHTSWDHPWIQNKDWYEQDSLGNIKYPREWRDVAQLNFKNKDMRLALIRSMKSWVLKANVDGFRCDFADGPPVDFWKQAIDTLRNIKSHKLLLLAEGTKEGLYGAGFDYEFGFEFYGNLKNIYEKNKSVKSIDSINVKEYVGSANGQSMVRYLTNHDVNSSDGTALDLFGGRRGSMAAFVVAAYMKGVPMIYNGQEIATPFRLTFPFTGRKIDWSLANSNRDVTSEYKKILAFRRGSMAIRRGTLKSYSSNDVAVFTKTHGSETVLVLSNLRDKALNYSVPAVLKKAIWKDAFTGKRVILSGELKLEAYQYLILEN